MRIVVTGASGFIGSHVVRRLLEAGVATGPDGARHAIDELVLVDPVAPDPRVAADPRVRAIVGDASDPDVVRDAMAAPVASLFALGATLTSQAETDFAHGMRVNLHGLIAQLDAARDQPRPPRMVFASSIAAFGGPLPDPVDDDVVLMPQTSYGTQKAIVELLVSDLSRRGAIDGRVLRLPIVIVRPGGPPSASASISDRLAALVREPLAGRDTTCPWSPDTVVPLAGVDTVAAALLALHDVPTHAFGPTRSLNLPAVSTRIDALVDAVARFAAARGIARPGTVAWRPDPVAQAVVDSWPRRFVSSRAATLGIAGDGSVDAIVAAYAAGQGAAADTAPVRPSARDADTVDGRA